MAKGPLWFNSRCLARNYIVRLLLSSKAKHLASYSGVWPCYRLQKIDSPIRLYCKLLACLAFLPLEDVVEAFEAIQLKAPKECVPLYKYFEENYIGKLNRGNRPRKDPMFALTQWNVHDRTMDGMPRTSNNIEGWHFGNF
jgi:hypothetical protein